MVQRLLLDRVDAKTSRPSVGSQHNASILRLPDETKATLPFMQLAFAGTEVALDATVIEVVPPLPENDSRLDHLAMACAHTLPSHSAKLKGLALLPPAFCNRKGVAP